MFNSNFYKKNLKKILLPINRIIESFFNELARSKSQSIRQTPLKKKINELDGRIESFFDKFKNLKKFNQGKKKFYYLNNKIAISIASFTILFFSYFLIPAFYKQDKIQTSLKNQILDRYEMKIEFNEKVKYGLFPRPFFYTKNLDIKYNEKVIANSGYVKFYISFKNFFLTENILSKNLVFQDTEFNINSNNINFFLKTLNSSDKENKFIFKKSKLFYKDQNDDLLFLSKINNFSFFYDVVNNLQKVKSNFEVFNIPFKLDISKNIKNEKKIIKLSSKKIRLNIETSVEHDEEKISGFFDIDTINKKNLFKYVIKDNSLNFLSSEKNFKGEINFKPFYFSTDLDFDYISQKKIFQSDSLLIDLLDSELLNNSNLNAVLKINIDQIDKFEYLKNFSSKINLGDGRIFMNDFKTIWNESVLINSNEIEFLNNIDGKKLVGEIIFNFKDVEKFFRYFQIKRNYRDVFDKIRLDFVYDLTKGKITINNLKIDNKSFKKIDNFINQYNKRKNNLFNKVTIRNFIKEFFQIYAG
ncbi:hypothetical protein [Candidatus Pelagibacter sp.]|uniref:hypothetical protein n=1 Tax=Candidatus Pelagibacter sp. TaxID=2024849 RepID=UPI003F8711B8